MNGSYKGPSAMAEFEYPLNISDITFDNLNFATYKSANIYFMWLTYKLL